MSAKEYMAVLANPWEAPPTGIIDEFSGKTCALRVNATVNLSTGVSENYVGALIKCSELNVAAIAQFAINDLTGIGAGGSVDTPLPGYADLAAHYSAYRPVSMGVKAYYTGAEGATSGTVSIVAVNGVDNTSKMPSDVDDWFNLEGCKTVACASMTGPLCAAVHSFDRPDFGPMNRTDTHLFFPTIGVFGVGLPAITTAIRLEVSFCLELIPLFGSILVGNSADVVMHDPVGMAQAHRRLPSIRTGDLNQIVTPLSSAVKRKSAGSSTRARKRRRPIVGHAPRSNMRVAPMGRRTTSKVYMRRTRKKSMLFRKR